MELREYQQRAVDELWGWLSAGNEGNPCVVMPTGSGKSHIVAATCMKVISASRSARILMVTHNKELVQQNFEKLLAHWGNAPAGICCAGLGKKDLGNPITMATIGSVANKVSRLGHIDMMIVDEAHGISHKEEGSYRNLINDLLDTNPGMKVVGLTATPYRLGHGLITDEPAIFSELLDSVGVKELIDDGYLSPLKSKMTITRLSTQGVKKRGGEYVAGQLAKAVDTDDDNERIAQEIIRHGAGRKSWLLFCASVAHAEHMVECLVDSGITAKVVSGELNKTRRATILDDFKDGRIQAIANCEVLTTGFDHPSIDLIAMLRPTASPGLYVQMVGRGLRTAKGKQNCTVLDFAGNVSRHGPITDVQPPPAKGKGEPEDAPVKDCPQCGEIVHASVMVCPECFYLFPKPEKEKLVLHDDDIMGVEPVQMDVTGWRWQAKVSHRSGRDIIHLRYYGALSDPTVTEYLTLGYPGFPGKKALRTLETIASQSGVDLSVMDESSTLTDLANLMNQSPAPSGIEYHKDGKFYRIIDRVWSNDERRVHAEVSDGESGHGAGDASDADMLRDMRMA